MHTHTLTQLLSIVNTGEPLGAYELQRRDNIAKLAAAAKRIFGSSITDWNEVNKTPPKPQKPKKSGMTKTRVQQSRAAKQGSVSSFADNVKKDESDLYCEYQ